MDKIILNGENLTIEDLSEIVNNKNVKVELSADIYEKVQAASDFVAKHVNHKVVYGINTGFGPMASHILGHDQLLQLQQNLIRSHAIGVGQPIDSKYVLAAMVVRTNTLARGYSGATIKLLKQLETFINHRIIPIVPEHGAVGTSGDLVQLAHIALALMGEGNVLFEGKQQKATDVISKLNIQAYILQPKEGLALINGTAMMSAISALVCIDAKSLLDVAIRSGAFALGLVRGFSDSLEVKLHELRPHPGQNKVAKMMRLYLESSKLLRNRKEFQGRVEVQDALHEIPESVQEVYSLRCIPQILGPVYDTLENTWNCVQTEINSVTDNPIIDIENEAFLHGGNFHGDYIAASIDQLKMTLVKMTMLLERQINFFLNRNVNKFFPPFLNINKPGLTLALQGMQFVATSTTAQSQTLAFPQYVHSISTNADNQDVVSMGTDAALLTAKVLENAYIVQAIELVTLAQAVDYLDAYEQLSDSSKQLYDFVRKYFALIDEDRFMSEELCRLVEELRANFKIRTKQQV